MSNTKEAFPQTQRYRSPDGTIRVVWDGKLHSWDGPALIPEGNMRYRKYFIYGFEYNEEEWKQAKRDWNGIPWYKDPRFNARN